MPPMKVEAHRGRSKTILRLLFALEPRRWIIVVRRERRILISIIVGVLPSSHTIPASFCLSHICLSDLKNVDLILITIWDWHHQSHFKVLIGYMRFNGIIQELSRSWFMSLILFVIIMNFAPCGIIDIIATDDPWTITLIPILPVSSWRSFPPLITCRWIAPVPRTRCNTAL